MATRSEIQTGLEITANVEGMQNIQQLTTSIEQAGSETANLSKEAEKLANQWKEVQSNQELINHYKSLKSALSENNQEIKYTEQAMRQLNTMMANGIVTSEQEEYKKLEKQLQKLNEERRNLSQSLRKTSSDMYEAGISVRNLANYERELKIQSEQAQQGLHQLNAEAQRLHTLSQARVTLGLDTDDKARQEIQRVTKAYEELKRSGTLSQSELARATDLHITRIRELEASLQQTRPSIMEIGSEISNLVGKAGGLAYLTKEAMAFETAMASVKKVTDGTPEQYEQLASGIKNLAGELGVMPNKLAEIAAQGGQAGIALEKLPQFTKMAAEMSVAFGISSESAGEMASKISNVFGIPLEKMSELNDAINTLGNTTAAKEAEISEVLMRIGGNAKQFGLAAE